MPLPGKKKKLWLGQMKKYQLNTHCKDGLLLKQKEFRSRYKEGNISERSRTSSLDREEEDESGKDVVRIQGNEAGRACLERHQKKASMHRRKGTGYLFYGTRTCKSGLSPFPLV
jgi:hypothetical protein